MTNNLRTVPASFVDKELITAAIKLASGQLIAQRERFALALEFLESRGDSRTHKLTEREEEILELLREK